MFRILALLGGTLVLTASAAGQSFTGTAEEVKDGDTITVQRGSSVVTVELQGVDAPERGQPYGEEAADYLRRQVVGDRVRVRVQARDKRGRLLATVVDDGEQVNRQLLQAGYAWYYWDYIEYTPAAASAQTLAYQAQQANRGLWAQPNPTPPWQWRTGGPQTWLTSSTVTGLPYDPSGRPRDCEDFQTRASAQRFLETALPAVTQRLDPDDDGVACEGGTGE